MKAHQVFWPFALLLAGLCFYFGLEPVGRALAQASAFGLLLYGGLTGAVELGYALRWRGVLRGLGVAVPVGRLVGARLAGDAVGSLVPSAKLAGEPVRVVLTGGGATATAGVALDRLLESIGNVVAVIGYAAVFWAMREEAGEGRTPLILAAAMAACGAGLVAPLVILWRGGRPLGPLYGERARRLAGRAAGLVDGLRRVEDELARLARERPAVLLWGGLGSVLIEVAIVAQYHVLLAAFGIVLDLPTLVLVLFGSGVARAMPAPAGLGALEAAQVAVVGVAAGRPDLGFVVGVIIQLHQALLLALGLAVLAGRGVSLARLLPARVRA